MKENGVAARAGLSEPRVSAFSARSASAFFKSSNLGEIEAAYASERGQPAFDPAMMTGLLLYGYSNGVYSSRWIAKATRERVDFLSIVGLDPPDFRTVSDFHSGT
jgi:transposase